ncbi:MAG: response regulator [Methylovirgula sp.]
MSKTILTVDDSRTMRDMLHLALSDAGYNVLQAQDGVHGLEVLQEQDRVPDVIVTDINMPRLDGFGFIEGVRRDTKHRAVPILVLTTESDAEKKDRARRAGATGWIVKPFDPVKLIAAIRRVAA